MKVIFVCTGNTCRSPKAEALMKSKNQQNKLDISVESCGTNVYESEPVNRKAVEALKTLGVTCLIHNSRQIDKSDLDSADVILTMTQQQKYSITKVYSDYKYKVFTINEYARDSKNDVTDPYGKSQIFYNFCVNELNVLVDELVEIFKEQME